MCERKYETEPPPRSGMRVDEEMPSPHNNTPSPLAISTLDVATHACSQDDDRSQKQRRRLKSSAHKLNNGRNMTTIPTFRILVVGGYDTGKSSFIDSLGAKSMETTHDSSNEKSVTFCFGSDSHKAVKVDFVELPSENFEAQYLEKLQKLPDEFDHINGVVLLFSYADIKSREPC
eukprot:scaffold126415_cov75-Attheya_sp.AAC.1